MKITKKLSVTYFKISKEHLTKNWQRRNQCVNKEEEENVFFKVKIELS